MLNPDKDSTSVAPTPPLCRVLCNSWPKAGTHVLLEVARLALGEGPWYKDPDIKYPQGEAEFLARAGERLRRYEGQSFAIKGHYGRTPVIEAFLAEHRFAHLFAVRDPREVLCSTQRWLRDLRSDWDISRHLAALDPAAQLEQIIVGLPLLSPFESDFAIRWDQPLPGRYAELTAWLDDPACCVVAYEDLAGMRGAPAQFNAIERALRNLRIPFDDAMIARIAGLVCNPHAATFHTGPASDWEKVFTERHRRLFVEHGGEALVERLGYPPTLPAKPRAARQPASSAGAAAEPGGAADAGVRQFVVQLARFVGAASVLKLSWESATDVYSSAFRSDGQPLGARRFQTPVPALPFKDNAFDAVYDFATLNLLDEASLPGWLAELRRVTGKSLWLSLAASPGRDRTWWERQLIEAGFRKHPLGQRIVPFNAVEKEGSTITLLFERIPGPALERYPVSALKAERDLHMDMLREAGPRSDAHIARYQLAAEQAPDEGVIVDAACGLGYGSAILARQHPGATVVGIDNSAAAIRYAKDHFADSLPNLEFHEADACDFGFLGGRRIDFLVSFETIEHIPDPARFLDEAVRRMNPNAGFVGSVPNLWVDDQGNNPSPFHLHVFDYDRFKALLLPHWTSLSAYRQNAERGVKGDHGRIWRRLGAEPPTRADLEQAEWWIMTAKSLRSQPQSSRALAPMPAAREIPVLQGAAGGTAAASPGEWNRNGSAGSGILMLPTGISQLATMVASARQLKATSGAPGFSRLFPVSPRPWTWPCARPANSAAATTRATSGKG